VKRGKIDGLPVADRCVDGLQMDEAGNLEQHVREAGLEFRDL